MASNTKVCSKQGTVEIDGLQLDVVCSNFGDRILLVVTELKKIGTLLEVSHDGALPSGSHTYSVKTLLGKDEAEVHVFGRAIASSLSLPPSLHMTLALGLKNHTPSILSSLLPQLNQFRTWEV